jgi:hypothetical protein
MAAELSVREGWSPPADLPRGECIFRKDADGIHIDQADPRILISAELLDVIVDNPDDTVWMDLRNCTTYDGGLLKIHGVNRSVTYRISGYVPAIRAFTAEMAD